MSLLQRFRTYLAGKLDRAGEEASPPRRGWTDREITNKEEDHFSFIDYAEVLAASIRQAGTPLTVGIYGSWGSGKTGLMRLIEGEFQDFQTIWINVWRLSNQEEVWHAFLQALFSEVHGRLSLWRRIDKGKLLRRLGVLSYRILLVITPMLVGGLLGIPDADWTDVLSLIVLNPFQGGPITGTGTILTYALGVWMLVRPAVEAARESVRFDLQEVLKYAPYEAQITKLMQLQKQFEIMVKLLVRDNERLVVFIDDLDRCSPEKIPDLLEAIKLFTTTRRCVYVLGLDYEIVRKGITRKYEFEDEREATEYLEKIVQVPFHLPPLEEGKIRNFIEEKYSDINDRCQEAAAVFSKGLEPNPRKVKRGLNVYRTVLQLADKRVGVWEMDPVEEELVAKMVVIQSRFRRLHDYLVRHPDFLIDLEKLVERYETDNKTLEEEMLNDDVELAKVLLGKPETEGTDAKAALISETDLTAFGNMLISGEMRFSQEGLRDQVSSYIYLTATAEGAAIDVRPNRKEGKALLGGDQEKITEQVEDIRKRGVEKVYIERLKGVLGDYARYTPSEVRSANMALDLLEGWERQDFEPETIRVPAGPFLMGSSDEDEETKDYEKPQHQVSLSFYRIGRYPVTNAEYSAYLQDTGYRPPSHWEGGSPSEEFSDHPVMLVNWEDANNYCKWLSEKTDKLYWLPTEAEWEKAARGTDGRIYPWGNEWDPERGNTEESGIGGTTPVGQYSPEADSSYGAADMAGNVFEWCADWYDEEEYKRREGKEIIDPRGPDSGALRVLRGGSWIFYHWGARCAFRYWDLPDFRYFDVGFRVVVSPSDSEL